MGETPNDGQDGPLEPDALVSEREAAQMVGYSLRYLWRLIEQGLFIKPVTGPDSEPEGGPH